MIPSLMQQQTQPAPQTGGGMPVGDMAAMMHKAKMFSDSELADILMGKSMAIPQFVAMTEAMGRKELRTAMDGQQAGQQPTIKDVLAADEMQAANPGEGAQNPQPAPQPTPEQSQGLAALPAPNMQEKPMAAGGIVAFNGLEDSLVQLNSQAKTDDDAKNEWLQNAKKTPPSPTTPSFLDTLPNRLADRRSAATDAAITKAEADAAAQDKTAGVKPAVNELALPTTPANKKSGIQTIATDADVEAIQKRVAPKAIEESKAQERPDVFAGMEDTKEALGKKVQNEKDMMQGEFLMQIGASLLKNPNAGVAISKGIEAGLPGLSASRKTINEIEKASRDYNFNLAKAKEARDQGNDDLAYKYADLADKSAYHVGMLAVENRNAGANELRASAAANATGSRADIRNDKRNQAILSSIDALYKSDMGNSMFAMQFAKMTPDQKETYYQGLRDRAVKDYNAISSASTSGGYSQEAIDAAIARKEKKS